MSARIFGTFPVDCSGGIITTSGGYTIHEFRVTDTADTFVAPLAFEVEYLILGAGADGAAYSGGGGGAGGLLTGTATCGTSNLVSVGARRNAVTGENSSALSLTALGGGRGGYGDGKSGGSGGGAGWDSSTAHSGGAGTPGQGNVGGNRAGQHNHGGAGGGGAGGSGSSPSNPNGARGGSGLENSISGTEVIYAAGGGGGGFTAGSGGPGGSNAVGGSGGASNAAGNAAYVRRGSGGGGSGDNTNEYGVGSDGLVILRYLTDTQVDGFGYA